MVTFHGFWYVYQRDPEGKSSKHVRCPKLHIRHGRHGIGPRAFRVKNRHGRHSPRRCLSICEGPSPGFTTWRRLPEFRCHGGSLGKSSNGGNFQLLRFLTKKCVESNANAKIKVTDPVVDGMPMPMPGLRETGFYWSVRNLKVAVCSPMRTSL